MTLPRIHRAGTLLVLTAALLGCQDGERLTDRGPTKAPGDTVPVFFIHDEEGTPMRELGQPDRPRGEPLAFAEESPQPEELPGVPEQAGADVELPAGVTQAMVQEGAQIFGTSCFACHGANGTGGPLAPALNDSEWLNIQGDYEGIVQVILNGVPQPKQYPAPMPPKGGAPITDEQVRQVAAYVYSISR